MSPLYIAFVEKIYIFGPVTGIMHVCYFLYVSKCLIQFAWQHRSTTVCKQIFNENILLIKMYRTHSHISFLINFYRPNWTFYWKSYAVRWVVCYLFIVKTLATCFGYYWVCLMLAANQAAQQMMQRDSCWFIALVNGTLKWTTCACLLYMTGRWYLSVQKGRSCLEYALQTLFLNCDYPKIKYSKLCIFYVKLLNACFEHCYIILALNKQKLVSAAEIILL